MFDNKENPAENPEEMSQEDRDKAELASLKQRAEKLGVTYSNNIKLETLREKVRAKMDGDEPTGDVDADEQAAEEEAAMAEIAALKEEPLSQMPRSTASVERRANPFEATKPLATMAQNAPVTQASAKISLRAAKRDRLIKDKMRLVRCRITNMDPKKKDLHGEVITVGNELLGTIKKFIPFGEATDNGYHVPLILFQQLQSRRFLHVKTTRDPRNGRINVHTSWQKEFALEVLDPLTKEEITDLKQAQIAAGSLDNPSLD